MILDEDALMEDIIQTLMNNDGYTREQATEFAQNHIEEIIDEMFEAETNYLNRNS